MKIVEIVEYTESHCPYCRYVYYQVLKPLEYDRRRINRRLSRHGQPLIPRVHIRPLDVDAHRGTKKMQWFDNYSRKIGKKATPVIEVGDKLFYMWKQKPDKLKKEKISRADMLTDLIIEQLQKMNQTVEKDGDWGIDNYAKELDIMHG